MLRINGVVLGILSLEIKQHPCIHRIRIDPCDTLPENQRDTSYTWMSIHPFTGYEESAK